MGALATLTNVILILAVVAVSIVCGLAAAEACGKIKAHGFETDEDLRNARALGAGAASVALIVSISSFIGMISLMFTPAIKEHTTTILYVVIFANVGALVGVSVLAGMGAKKLGDWLLLHDDDVEGLISSAKTNLVWSCALAVVALVLLIVYFVYELVTNKKEREKDE